MINHVWAVRSSGQLGIDRLECKCGAVQFSTTNERQQPIVDRLNKEQGVVRNHPEPAPMAAAASPTAVVPAAIQQPVKEDPPVPKPGRKAATDPRKGYVFPPEREKEFLPKQEEILGDYYAMETIRFLRKWHISSQTWNGLKRLWNVKLKDKSTRHKQHPGPKQKMPAGAAAGAGLVAFPAFSNEWPAETQCKWLDCYMELRKIGNGVIA